MKRFWKHVEVAGGEVRLDDRPVRTPGRALLVLPSQLLAEAVGEEWRAVGEKIDPRAMVLTGLANAAIDRVAPDRLAFAESLARYGETDLLCYRADAPADLVRRQAERWDPPLAWARQRYDVHFELVTGVIHRPQPPATIERLAEAARARGAFELAAMSPIVTVTGSLVLSLALLERALDAETVWQAAILDEQWQAKQWGEDPLAEAATATRKRDFDAGARMLELLRAG